MRGPLLGQRLPAGSGLYWRLVLAFSDQTAFRCLREIWEPLRRSDAWVFSGERLESPFWARSALSGALVHGTVLRRGAVSVVTLRLARLP